MSRVTIYSRNGCHLCEQAERVIRFVQRSQPFDLEVVDIDRDATLREKYNEEVPVIAINGVDAFRHGISSEELRKRLKAAG